MVDRLARRPLRSQAPPNRVKRLTLQLSVRFIAGRIRAAMVG